MNLHPRQPEVRSDARPLPEALPEGTPVELIVLDRRLHELAGRESTPPDLTGRVYRASVEHLPQPVPASLPFRCPAATSARRTPRWWGQAALAASLGLAFVFAGRVMLSPPVTNPDAPQRGDGSSALFAHHAALPVDRSVRSSDLLSDDEVRMLMPGGDVEYLLVTRDLTMSDLSGDLDRLYDELGM